jgi:Ca-activated chloride channel homolog
MKKIGLIITCVLLTAIVSAQTAHKHLRSGDKNYEKQNYAKAEEEYRKAQTKDNSPNSNYNLGNAVYQQERYEEAIKHYQSSAQNAKSDAAKAKALYNMANAHLNAYQKPSAKEGEDKSKHLQGAIDGYKEALRLSPKDMDAKHNLTMALQEMKKQQQKQQNKNQDKQQQNQNKQDDKNKKQEDKDKGQEEKDKNNGNQDKNQPQNQKGDKNGQDMKKEEAEKLLQIMNDEERKVQEKLNKTKPKRSKSNKDW